MNLFLGQSEHTLDSKSRLFVPKRMVEGIDDLAERVRFVVALGTSSCLYLFTRSDFLGRMKRLRSGAFGGTPYRNALRGLTQDSYEQSLDSQGRLLIPEKLRERTGIEREVVVVGVGDYIEVWARDTWEAASGTAQDAYLELADELFGGTGEEG